MDSLSSTLVVDKVVSFLTHWLAFHILETDKHMAKIVLAIQQGLPLPDAKDRANTEMSGAMRVLIETILHMYDHLYSGTLELLREIGERQRAEEGLRLSKNVIDSTLEAIFITDSECMLIETNPSFRLAVGRQHQDMMGVSIRQIMASLFSQEKYDEIMKEVIAGGHWTGELSGRNASDELEAVWLNAGGDACESVAGLVTGKIGERSRHVAQRLRFEFQENSRYHAARISCPMALESGAATSAIGAIIETNCRWTGLRQHGRIFACFQNALPDVATGMESGTTSLNLQTC